MFTNMFTKQRNSLLVVDFGFFSLSHYTDEMDEKSKKKMGECQISIYIKILEKGYSLQRDDFDIRISYNPFIGSLFHPIITRLKKLSSHVDIWDFEYNVEYGFPSWNCIKTFRFNGTCLY